MPLSPPLLKLCDVFTARVTSRLGAPTLRYSPVRLPLKTEASSPRHFHLVYLLLMLSRQLRTGSQCSLCMTSNHDTEESLLFGPQPMRHARPVLLASPSYLAMRNATENQICLS
jgi:hypothetical protein